MAVLRKYNPDIQQWEILQGGVQGLQGPPVALAKGTVTTTAAGTNADFSITGTPPAQVLNMTLPRGEAGGWITTQINASTQDMNLLTTPGSYKDNTGSGEIGRGYPEDGWQGIHEVVGVHGHTIQRTTNVRSTANPEDNRTYMRVLRSGTWSPWRRVPLVGQIHLDIVGAGRPDVPASMTAEVAALVAAATSGAKFRSTNGPQGAWEWQKRGASWECVEGDTGYLDFAPLVVAGWGAISVGKLRRIGSVVHVLLRDVSHSTDNTDANSLLLNLPTGFTPITTTIFITSGVKNAYIAGSGIYYPKRTGVGQSAYVSFAVTSSWPTTLTI